MNQEQIIKLFSVFGGRKMFIVFLTTLLLLCRKITGDQWVLVMGLYFGANVGKGLMRRNEE